MSMTEIDIATIGLVLTFVTVFVGWVIMFNKERKKRASEAIQTAYEKGKHDAEHTKLNTQIDAAHKKIRTNHQDLDDVKATLNGHTKVHDALLHGQKTQQHALSQIQQILMEEK